jgi:hypothetical protein
VLWWRAQLRRRDDAVKRLQRPLLGAQVFAMAVALAMLAGTLVYEAAHGMHWMAALETWLVSLKQSPAMHFDALWPFASGQSAAGLLYLVPGAAILLLVGGAAVYLATEKQ